MIKHYLNFVSTGRGMFEIDEPTGFDQALFEIEQEEGRHGRDVFLVSNEKGKLVLNERLNHRFDYVMEAMEKDGFEAEVKYIVEFDGVHNVVGDISFQAAATDGRTYIELAIVEENFKMLLKKRFDVKTDLFSETSLDDQPITPVTTKKALIKAKPIVQISEWNNQIIGKQINSNSPTADYFNVVKNQVQYDIKNSLTWLSDFSNTSSDNFRHIQAQTNLTNVKIEMDLNVHWYYNVVNAGVGGLSNFYGYMNVRVLWGQSILDAVNNGKNHYLFEHYFYGTTNQEMNLPSQLSYTIPFVNATDYIWLSFSFASSNGSINTATFYECTTKIKATSIAYNSVVDMVRLVDAMKYNALSSANLPVSAPRWDAGGELYNLYITSQALMRGLTDKPFNISTKEIVEEYLPMVNGDYQIQQEGTVFYGIEEDFYRNYEILSLTQQEASDEFGQPLGQIEGFERAFNSDFTVNEFKYGFKNYASKKESEEGNTYDIVHGEIETLLPNKRVENKIAVEVGWIFDAFMWELARVKAFDLSDNTATQDDDKIYCMELTDLQDEDREFTETATLHHIATGTDFKLQLNNDQSFSWVLLGIEVGSQIQITTAGANTPDGFFTNNGTYTVLEVSDVSLYLETTGGTPEPIGIINTTFTYQVALSITLTNRTNEGFAEITGIADGDNYGNLAHTTKRNILKYWNSHLATCCMYNPELEIKVTDYKNNPDAYTRLETEAVGIKEGDNITPSNAILTPYLPKIKAIMSLQKFFDTQTKQRLHNGFVRSFDSTGLPLLGYIKKANFIPTSRGGIDASDIIGECELVLKEKYQEFYIQILGSGNGMIVLSNGESASDFNFYIENKKMYIFDETGKQLFVPVPFNRVKVNSSTQADTPDQLEQWLNLLKQ